MLIIFPQWLNLRPQLIDSGKQAAESARKTYKIGCLFNSLEINPYKSEFRQRVTYENAVKQYRYGETFLKLGLESRDSHTK